MKRFALAAAFAFALTPAFAADVNGEWLHEDGKSKVHFAACGGGAVCGTISWLKDPATAKGKVGQKVFYEMKPNGDNSWAGKAFNPDDGNEYTGKMSLAGDSLHTSGCVFGGLICKSVDWTRVK